MTNIESGVCIGIGGTNARRAVCINGDIEGFNSVETPRVPSEFFNWMARQVLTASDAGHGWMVAGYPGPVSPDGKIVGPLTNVAGMKKKGGYDFRKELVAVDSAVEGVLDNGFVIVNVNDGPLAAQAVAARFAAPGHKKVSALIIGTGIGAGVVERDPKQEAIFRVDKNPGEIGHLPDGEDPHSRFEDRFSGPGLEKTYGRDPRELEPSHPAWHEVGVAAGRLTMTLGLMNGVHLVVPTGGVGAGASDKLAPHLDDYMLKMERYGNGPQTQFMPDVMYVPPSEAQAFEMFGAEGVMRDYYTSQVA